MPAPRITLEQWLTFKTVVDAGSYALAAETLNKSQSAVSYAISRLNARLPQPVLTLDGRKAVLTDAGQTLYRYADTLLSQASTAEAVATSLALGYESEVVVAIDTLVDIGAVLGSFEIFSTRFPHTRIRVLELTLSATTEALLEKQADLVLGPDVPVGYTGKIFMQVEMIPVAAPHHPLVKNRKDVPEIELRTHRQVVLRDMGTRREQDAGWLGAEQRWTVSHFSTSVQLLKAGLVFGFIPRRWVRRELEAGDLVQLPLAQDLSRSLPVYLMQSEKEAAGPATRALAALLVNHAPGKGGQVSHRNTGEKRGTAEI